MKPEHAIRIIDKIFNPIILLVYGWKRKRSDYDKYNPIHWKDPKTGQWWTQDAAIEICGERLK